MARKRLNNKNMQFLESAELNTLTYFDYLNRFEKLSRSIFEWVNLPESMNAIYLEKCLYFYGQAGILKDKKYGFINTQVTSNGKLNIYGLPTNLHCWSFEYQTNRILFVGNDGLTEEEKKAKEYNEVILVQNNWERIPTAQTMQLFAMRLYECDRTCDVNIKAQKTPVLLLVDEKQRTLMENLYSQFDGNRPFIFGDKLQLDKGLIQAISTEAPFIADKITEYKKEIWNEALTFLGINNILVDKKERLITDEANSNNELINLNLQSYLQPRKLACEQFNKKFNLTGNKKIDVRVRSDLHNVIKNLESSVNDLKDTKNLLDKEGEKDGNLYDGT